MGNWSKEEFAARLKSVVEQSSRSRAEFGRMAEIADTTLKNYMSGITQPGAEELAGICDAAGVRIEWLLFGRPPQKATDDPGETQSGPIDKLNWFRKGLVFDVVEALSEELAAAKVDVSPKKLADLVCAACIVHMDSKAISRDAIKTLMRLAS